MSKSNYVDWGKKLRSWGIIDKSYQFNKPLNKYQKGVITKKMQEYGHAVRRPELFHIATVAASTKKLIKRAGYKVTKTGKVLIPLREYTSATITKNKIVFKNGRGLEDTQFLSNEKNFLEKLKSLTSKKLSLNKMVTLKIGDNSPFSKRFSNYRELYHYLNEEFSPKDIRGGRQLKKAQILPLISIVEVPNVKTTIKKSTKQLNKKRGK